MNMTKSTKTATYNMLYVYFVCFVAALGGLMFGFDLGIITGVVPYIEHQFKLSSFGLGLVVAIFELGAMTGALCTARIADKFGRKKTMIVCALLFAFTALCVAFASRAVSLASWRFTQGLCVGAASVLSPMYIAEMSPAKVRGRLVSINQLTIILGILIASFSNFYFGNNDLNSSNWRYMFLSALVPSILFLVLLFLIPESPRWLIIQSSREEEANRIFLKINNGNEVLSREEIMEIRNSIANSNAKSRVALKTLFGKAFLPIILIGFGVAFLQQFCGINNVTPYMQKIFIMAGIQLKDGLLNAVLVQLVFFFATFIAIGLVDKIGRKMLMLVGTGLMAITLFLLALAFQSDARSGLYILILVMIYIGAFAFTLGPVVWVLISEMYPNEIRGRAIALTSAALWLATFLVVLISPYLLNIGPVFNFVIFGILNVVGFFFCLKYLPETKEKTLEQMKEVWQKKGYLKTNKPVY
jgi:SP family arabinose:H+ symporter-like MFS transporter